MKILLLKSLLVGFGLTTALMIMGLMNMYPENWDEFLPGTVVGRMADNPKTGWSGVSILA